MIEFKNVKKTFKDTEVLHGLNFTIEDGQIVVLIGLSGCGKTTSLKMINKLIKPSSGQILINGKDIADENSINLRRNIGYVIQQTGLFPHLTVRENIEIIAKVEKIDKNKISQKTLELMKMVGLDESFLDRYPNELSGGQQQRIGVARAFALDPDVILMDEPFSALDPITRNLLQDELVDLQAKLKKTIVFVTHDMSEAIRIADKICIMDSGNIVQYDSPENILKNPVNDFVLNFVGKNRIWQSPEYIYAKDILIENVITCRENISIIKALDIMRTKKVNSLMVVGEDHKCLNGVINARMILKNGYDNSSKVKDIMNKDYIWASEQSSIIDLLKLSEENNLAEIPILDSDKKIVGLVTQNSLISALSEQYIDKEMK